MITAKQNTHEKEHVKSYNEDCHMHPREALTPTVHLDIYASLIVQK